jgi:hypothetical protein
MLGVIQTSGKKRDDGRVRHLRAQLLARAPTAVPQGRA